MSHGTRGIIFGDLNEFFFCLLVPKRMEQCDAPFKWLLYRGRAGDGEMHRPQLFRSQVFVMMAVIGQRRNCK